ncbi:hypothetical protein IAR55_005569 [Kwoniella newhampshirensis]|uniref:Major facilitator superfamily (MFS) profile domain-containing protein n=1 Tax=Kwoniella newhampshirensis TaxID=1651941 RepID=A0AAW0YHU6_9TREE
MAISKRQLAVLLLARIVEPIGYAILFPFVNNMMEDILPDVPKASIGKYSGAIESVWAFSSVLFMYRWGKLSDKIGRKPVILGGLFGLSFSLVMFGLSKSFWWAMGARALSGMLCGNASVMRAVLGEITTKETEGWVYPLWTICWDLSCVIAPAIGALVQNPAKQYPNSWIGQIDLLKKFPYFLPCALAASLSFLASFLVLFCLDETLPAKRKAMDKDAMTSPTETTSLLSHQSDELTEVLPTTHTFMDLISIRPVQQVIISQFLITLAAMSFDAVLVLFFYSSPTLGGIGLLPSGIALILSLKGGLSIILSLLFFPLAQRKFGVRILYPFFASCWIVCFIIPPLMNLLVSGSHGEYWIDHGMLKKLWVVIIPFLLFYVFGDFCFPLNMMALNAVAPSASSLGAINAVALVVSALARSVGPATAGALYSLSAEKNFPIVWIVFGGICTVTTLQSTRVKGRQETKVVSEEDATGNDM